MNGMDFKFAPWRSDYIKGEKITGCVFCKDSTRNDSLILHEGKHAFATMNLYPYNSGHLMIIPLRHVSQFEDLTGEEKTEMFGLVDTSLRALKQIMKPEGFNIGMNLGQAAGAGVEDHLHIHVVPRWSGDTNYMSTIGEVRVIPEDLLRTMKQLLPYFNKETSGGSK
jgi:ATP adenylyltransferase